jgi:predicted permease
MFTAVTLLTLAVGIGANTAIFSVLEGVLLRPLPYPHPEQLVTVSHSAPGWNLVDVASSPSTYFVYREQSRSFENIALYSLVTVNVTGGTEPERVQALDVTDGLLPILGVSAFYGRLFTRADDAPGGADFVLLTYGYWQRRFGADRSAISRVITVDGITRQIIGVLPQGFHFLDRTDPALILPFKFDRAKTTLGDFGFPAIARLKPGVTLAQANGDVARMLPIVQRSFPPPPGFSLKLFEDARIGPNLRSLKQDVVGDVGKILWVLMCGIGLVLLIACANVSNLLLVRAEGRQRELAIRAALGAGRGRIAQEMLFESLILALLASVVGLGLAYGALRVLVATAPEGLPRLSEIRMDVPVALYTLAVAVLASLLFGSLPIFKYAGRRLGTGLREGGRSMSEGRERQQVRGALVIVQVALALVLLISSGLMMRTFRALTRVDPGFVAPSEVQTCRVAIPEIEVKDPKRVARVEEEILAKLAAIPGVTSVASSMSVPLDGNPMSDPVYVKDGTDPQGNLPLRRYRFVSPGFFKTMGTRLIAGRDLTWNDVFNKLPVALLSEKLARTYWHEPTNALGKQIRASEKDDWREVVGVVEDIRDDGVSEEAPASVYWPILTARFMGNAGVDVRRDVVFSIRSPRAGSRSLMNEVRQAVWSVDSSLPLADVYTLDFYYRRSMARTSFSLVMLVVAGGMALLLGVVGLCGVVAYSVSKRRREIGIRMALGARHQELTGMFVRQTLGLATVGVACGLAVAPALTRLMSSLLFGVRSIDPVTYGATALGLILTAAVASYLPARRAAAVNPVESLRAE